MRLKNATGLSRRVIDHGKSMRTLFDIETAKAIAEEQSKISDETVAQSTEINGSNEDESDEEDSENENGESDRDDEEVNTLQGVKKRSPNGEGKRLVTSKNRYRSFFSSKARKVRSDIITGEEVQEMVSSMSQFDHISIQYRRCTAILRIRNMVRGKGIAIMVEICP